MREYSLADFVPVGHHPSQDELKNLSNLAELILEPVMIALDTDINISSGLRIRNKNLNIGGVVNSDHLFGAAVDLTPTSPKVSIWDFFRKVISLDTPYRQTIYSIDSFKNRWLHISVNHKLNKHKHEALIENEGKFFAYNKEMKKPF